MLGFLVLLLKQSTYAKLLHPLLPKEAFSPDPHKLLILGLNVVILCLGWSIGRQLDHWPSSLLWAYLPFAFVMGNSVIVLAFSAHDLLHGSVLRQPQARHWLGFLGFALHHMPPTLWKVMP